MTGKTAGAIRLFEKNGIICITIRAWVWQLAANPIEFLHCSAKFYLTGVQGIYPVTNFMEMEDVNFNSGKDGSSQAQRPPAMPKG